MARILIVMDGGLIQGIYSDEPVDILTKDYDARDDNNCRDSDGTPFFGCFESAGTALSEEGIVDGAFKLVDTQLKALADKLEGAMEPDDVEALR